MTGSAVGLVVPGQEVQDGIVVLYRFIPSSELVVDYASAYNGTGWERVKRSFLGLSLGTESARHVLSEVVEGAFMATAQMLRKYSEHVVSIDKETGEPMLLNIMRRRMHCSIMGVDDASLLAERLLEEVHHKLSRDVILLIDGGKVFYRYEKFYVKIYDRDLLN